MTSLLNATVFGLIMTAAGHSALADAVATPVQSSIESYNEISLGGVDESDLTNPIEIQDSELNPLGPVIAKTEIEFREGLYTALVGSTATFESADQGSFRSGMNYSGMRGDGNGSATSFRHSLDGIFIYDFTIPAEGTLNIEGMFSNSGPSSLSYFAFVQVFSEDEAGDGFGVSYFDSPIYDLSFSGQPFNMDIPLNAPSGSYRMLIRISHNGLTQLDSPISDGWIEASFEIDAEPGCTADLNKDGDVNFFDISFFLKAFAERDEAADLNNDGNTDFFDLSSFINAYSIGCD